jgi:hypothetical protein
MLRFLHVFIAVAALLVTYILFLFFMGWFDFDLAKGSITILDATYGENCGAGFGNATGHIAKSCTGLEICTTQIDVAEIGDPAPACAKEFKVEYNCGPGRRTRNLLLAREANGRALILNCMRG